MTEPTELIFDPKRCKHCWGCTIFCPEVFEVVELTEHGEYSKARLFFAKFGIRRLPKPDWILKINYDRVDVHEDAVLGAIEACPTMALLHRCTGGAVD